MIFRADNLFSDIECICHNSYPLDVSVSFEGLLLLGRRFFVFCKGSFFSFYRKHRNGNME